MADKINLEDFLKLDSPIPKSFVKNTNTMQHRNVPLNKLNENGRYNFISLRTGNKNTHLHGKI